MYKLSIILLNAFPDKKLKSLGNKCLIKLSNDRCLIDYHISILNKLFHFPEIIVVGSFESKKLSKYLKQKYHDYNIKHVHHEIDNMSNIGTSVVNGVEEASNKNILLINSSILLNKTFHIDLTTSSIIINKKKNGNIGCVIENNNVSNCYYGIDNEIYDMLYISSKDYIEFKYLLTNPEIKKLYLFEIMNLCITNNIILKAIDIKNQTLNVVDSNDKIRKLKNKLCI